MHLVGNGVVRCDDVSEAGSEYRPHRVATIIAEWCDRGIVEPFPIAFTEQVAGVGESRLPLIILPDRVPADVVRVQVGAGNVVDRFAGESGRRDLFQERALAFVPFGHGSRLVVAEAGIDHDAFSATLDQQRKNTGNEVAGGVDEMGSQPLNRSEVVRGRVWQHDRGSHRHIFGFYDPGDADFADLPALHFRFSASLNPEDAILTDFGRGGAGNRVRLRSRYTSAKCIQGYFVSGFGDIPATLSRLEKRRLYRRRRVVEGPLSRVITVEGRELLNFCSNDYLGLAAEPRVAAAFKAGVDRWGVGSGASHLVCGHTAVHQELEEALADFTGRERALLFSTGYGANLGAINALVGKRDHVIEDRLNHASLLDGGWISGAGFHWYAHADMQDLEAQLRGLGDAAAQALVISDGTFSMDGDRCPIAELTSLVSRHNAWLMIDDAHGFGVHGEGGRGLVDPAKFDSKDVPVLMATLGKAVGTFGAFIAGDAALIEFLVQRARNYIYSTAVPAAVASATLASLELVQTEDWRRERLGELISRFRAGAAQLGLDLLPSDSPIQPVVVGDSARALEFSAELESRGVLVTAIRPPTVPNGTARLRVTLTAAHEDGDVDHLLTALDEVMTEARAS